MVADRRHRVLRAHRSVLGTYNARLSRKTENLKTQGNQPHIIGCKTSRVAAVGTTAYPVSPTPSGTWGGNMHAIFPGAGGCGQFVRGRNNYFESNSVSCTSTTPRKSSALQAPKLYCCQRPYVKRNPDWNMYTYPHRSSV